MEFTAKQLEAIKWAIEYTMDGIEEHPDFEEDEERNEIHAELDSIAGQASAWLAWHQSKEMMKHLK